MITTEQSHASDQDALNYLETPSAVSNLASQFDGADEPILGLAVRNGDVCAFATDTTEGLPREAGRPDYVSRVDVQVDHATNSVNWKRTVREAVSELEKIDRGQSPGTGLTF